MVFVCQIASSTPTKKKKKETKQKRHQSDPVISSDPYGAPGFIYLTSLGGKVFRATASMIINHLSDSQMIEGAAHASFMALISFRM